MLFRFSLYGFLKNQRYLEPFLLLAFLDRGLSFTTVGLLIGFRELCVNLLEIPSGALADSVGRRRMMIASFVAYLVAFVLLGWTTSTLQAWIAMAMFGVGDSFRTGTHKAMIFSWLRSQGRTDERTEVYGFTRSWSKIGSAVSTLLGMVIVLTTDSYQMLFQLATIPYVLGIVNFLGYPGELDANSDDQDSDGEDSDHDASDRGETTVARAFSRMREAVREAFRRAALRRLLVEGLAFGGTFRAVQDYLQPLLLVALGGALDPEQTRAAALAVGPAYIVIFLGSSWASRQAHRVVEWSGGEDAAARRLWCGVVGIYATITVGILIGATWVAVVAFALLFLVQNVFRPVLVARFDQHGDERHGATLLSVESQVSRLGTVVLAPAIGAAVDAARSAHPDTALWPTGAAGVLVTLLVLRSVLRRPADEAR